MVETLEEARDHENYQAPLAARQGRGVATGFWPNYGGETSVTLNVNTDGTVLLSLGTPDIGGSRASMCLMAAEELGVPYERVRAIIADTNALSFNATTGGSRVTHSAGMATVQAARNAIDNMRGRVAEMWGIDAEAVEWEDGYARPSGSNGGRTSSRCPSPRSRRSPPRPGGRSRATPRSTPRAPATASAPTWSTWRSTIRPAR